MNVTIGTPVFQASGVANGITVSGLSVPAGSYLTVEYIAENTGAETAWSVTNDGTAITWGAAKAQVTTVSNTEPTLWAAFVGATPPASITVTATAGGTLNNAKYLQVKIHDGAHATNPLPSGNIFSGAGGTNVTQAITPTSAGSALHMFMGDWVPTNTFGAAANCTLGTTGTQAGHMTAGSVDPTTQPRPDTASFTIGETDTGGKIAWIAYEVQAAPAVLAAPSPQGPLQYRPPLARPQSIAAGLALFVTAATVAVPSGSTALVQAAAAYREASRLTAQPRAPSAVFAVVATGQAVPPARAFQPTPQAWPAATFADLIGGPAVLIQAAPVLRAAIPQAPPAAPWNYAATMLLPAGPAPLIPSLGTQIPPSPVLQWVTQTAYPYAATLLPAPTSSQWTQATAYALSPTLNPVRSPEWPYVATSLPQPTASRFASSTAYAYSPGINPVRAPDWPYASTLIPAPTASQFAMQVLYSLSPTVNPVRMPEWPYAATLLPKPTSSQWAQATAYTLSPVINPVRLPDWPYASTLIPVPTASQFGQLVYTFAPTLNPVRQPEWPYVAAMLPEPVSSQWAQSTAYALSPPINPVREPEWPYVATMLPAPTASRHAQQAGQPAPGPTPQLPQQPWPHALIATTPVRVIADVANVPPSSVAQIAQAAWPYGLAMRAGAAMLAQQPYLAPAPVWVLPASNWPYAKHAALQATNFAAFKTFIVGNSEVWLIDMRQRAVTIARRQRDTEVDARPRVWQTPDH